MVEYVYALHDFEPQNDDEISFVAGERIEVLERDDAYGDGWWTGRNLAGHEGIFPKDYTTPAGPLIPDLRTPTGASNFNIHNGISVGSSSGFHGSGYGSTLHPLTEENESDSAQGAGGLSVPNGIAQGGGHVMAATMTDVQQAIDQLGVHRSHSALTDDGRSMSYASTRDDRTSIYEPDGNQVRTYEDGRSVRESIWDEPDATPGGTLRMTMNEEWHRNARRRLFEKVDQIDMERRREEEEEEAAHDRHYHRPPLDVEFSDESEDEDGHHDHDHHHHHHHHHQQPPNDLHHRLHHDDSIPSTLPSTLPGTTTGSLSYGKEDPGADADISTATTTGAKHLTDSPAKADSPTLAFDVEKKGDVREATPTNIKEIAEERREKTLTPTPAPEPPFQAPSVDPVRETPSTRVQDKPQSTLSVPQTSASEPLSVNVHTSTDTPAASVAPSTVSKTTQVESVKASPISPLPSAASYVSFLPSPTNATFNTGPSNTSMSQVTSTISKSPPLANTIVPRIHEEQGDVTTAPSSGVDQSGTSVGPGNASIISSITSASLAPPSSAAPSQTSPQPKKTPPSEWTVEQVVEWIRGKGFDEGVCSKFAEHEITGDILLEFDANMLKEIDIVAFGKRIKIANAINELRRPPSFESSDAASLKPQSLSQFSLVGQQPTYSNPPPPQNVLPGFSPSVSMPNIGVNHGHTLSQSTQGYNASVSSAGFSMNSPGVFGMLQAQNPQNQGHLFNSPGNYSPNLLPGGPSQNDSPIGYDRNVASPENSKQPSAPHVHARVDSDPGVGAMGEAARMIMAMNGYSIPDKAATIGYSAGKDKNRPSSLALSPNDGALGKKGIIPVTEDDDRAAMSDSDIRKRKEIMSLDSAASHNPPDTPRSDTPSHNSARPRSSLDTRPSERLSFFSAMRSRKPAPRYSSDHSGSELGSPNISQAERQTTYSKLYLAGATKPPRVKAKEKEKKEKEEKTRAHRESKDDKGKGKDVVHEADKEGGAAVLRKRTLSGDPRTPGSAGPETATTPRVTNGVVTLRPGENVLQQFKEILGEPDHSGFMLKKGERYNTWKSRFFFLKGTHLYYLRGKQETRIKGYINIKGYKIIADEAAHPGRYGFRIIHDKDKPHFFSSEDQLTIRDWMKALMKATIDRDFARPVISSCNIPTIPLAIAQSMNPAPRPPSPRAIAAAQMASRQADSSGLLNRDTKMLMGIAEGSAVLGATPTSPAPQRPSREMRRPSIRSEGGKAGGSNAPLIQWINSLLPDQTPHATDLSISLSSGLILFRLAESIKYGREQASARLRSPSPDDPIVPDKYFDDGDERIEGLMKLFDFLVDNDVKLSGISMADVKQGRSDKIIALVQSMKQWYERREAIVKSVGVGGVTGLRTWIHG